jgi:TetR/AcrR family transcriptional regulator, ethionamide resistance regulator
MKSSKSDLRRAALLGGLRSLLERRGYADIGVGEISAEADVTRPAFYFYFSSKAEALAALLEELEEEFVSAAASWYDHEGEGELEKLVLGMRQTVHLWRNHSALMLAMVDAAAVDSGARQYWSAFRDHFVARAATRISRDCGQRLVASGVDVDVVATVLTSAAFAALEADTRSGGTGSAEALADGLAYTWCAVIYGDRVWVNR